MDGLGIESSCMGKKLFISKTIAMMAVYIRASYSRV